VTSAASPVTVRRGRTRMGVASLSLLVLLLLAGILGYFALSEVDRGRSIAQQDALRYSREAALGIDAFLASTHHMLTTLAVDPAVKHQESEMLAPMLAELLEVHPQYSNIWATRADGWNYASALPPPGGRHIYIADRYYFQMAVQMGEMFIQSVPDNRRDPSRFAVVIAVPTRDAGGAINGTVQAAFDLLPMQELLSELDLPTGARVTMLDESGFVVARHPSPELWVGRQAEGTRIWQDIQVYGTGVFQGALIDGDTRLAGYTTTPLAPWKVIVSVDPGMAYAGLWGALLRELLILALPVLAIVYLTLRLGRLAVERAEANEALQRQGEFLKALIDASPVGIAVVRGQDYRYSLANPSYRAIPGAPDLPVVGRTVGEVFPSVEEEIRSLVDEVREKGERLSVREYEVSVGPGREKTFWNVDHVALPHRESDVGEVLIITQEVTAQVLARREVEDAKRELEAALEELREREELKSHLAAVVESSEDAIIGKTLDDVVTSWNAGAEKLYGYTAQEMVGSSASILSSPGLTGERREIFERVQRGEGIRSLETVRIRKDGTPVQVSLSLSPVRDGDGRITGFSTIARDITDRKRAEVEREQLLQQTRAVNQQVIQAGIRNKELAEEAERRAAEMEAVLNSITDGIVVCDRRGRTVRINAAAQRMLELSGDDLGLPVEKQARLAHLETPEGNPFPAEQLPAVRALRGETVDEVLMVVRKSSERALWLAVSAAPVCTAAGGTLGAVVSYTDVTARHEMEEMREDFLRGVSHDLRTPLTVIQGHAQLMLQAMQGGGDGRMRQSAESVYHGAKRMALTLRDLVDCTRVESHQLRLERERADLASFLFDVLDRTRGALAVDRVKLDIAPGIPPIEADLDRLERVFINLLSNALKYSPNGSPVLVRAEAGKREVLISVIDRGPGIAPEELPRVFERFYRAGEARRAEGLGLGLHITRLLVEAHGGRIWVESERGKGSAFNFALPVTSNE
jgi:PAS domain S-box-containing protein